MRKAAIYNQRHKEFRILIETTFQDLIKLKEKGDKVSFNTRLLKILPKVKKYINENLNSAIKKGRFSKSKYKANDFIDQLFIEIYDHIDEVKREKNFYLWLFKKTNKLIEDAIEEEKFEDFFFKNIDNFSKPEWDEMAENFSTDGDGDLLMIEELDDSSYNKNDYTLNQVFIEDDENELTEQLDKTLNDEQINRHIKMVLNNMPLAMRTVFDLYNNQQFTLEEISTIKNSSVEEVEKHLKGAKKALQVSLFNRYKTT